MIPLRACLLPVAFLGLLGMATTAQAAWETPAGPAGAGASVDVAVLNGAPHVGWVANIGRTPKVARQTPDGTGWVELGAGRMSRGGTLVQRIALAEAGGQVYAAWAENDQAGWLSPRVSRYDAGTDSWVAAPEGLSDRANEPDFGVTMTTHQDRPHVAFVERDSAFADKFQVKVKRLSAGGTAWDRLGGPINASSQAASLPILGPTRYDATDPDLLSIGSTLYVAWAEFDGFRDQVRVARYDAAANAWREIGGGARPINHDGSGDGQRPSLAAIAGVPHVAWQQAGQIRVARMRDDGSGFDQVVGGDAPINPGVQAEKPSLADVGGRPWVSFIECPAGCGTRNPSDLRVARLNSAGTAWERPTQEPVEASGDPRSTALAVAGGTPLLAADVPGISVARLAPDILETSATGFRGGATLLARVRGYGLPWKVGFEIDGVRTATRTLGGGDEETVTMSVGGLRNNTVYGYRAFATGPLPPEVLGPAGTFRTGPGKG